MLHSTSPNGRRRRRLVILAATSVAVLAAAAVYVALSPGQSTTPLDSGPASLTRTSAEPRPGRPSGGVLPPLEPTAEPEAFAELVAHAIFDWDTTTTIPLTDYTARLLAVADPTGESSPGLVADIANYLPTPAAWAQLRPYSTRQWLELDSVEVPALWPQAVAEAGPNGLLPGTTAYTITGARHRAGIWEGEPVEQRARRGVHRLHRLRPRRTPSVICFDSRGSTTRWSDGAPLCARPSSPLLLWRCSLGPPRACSRWPWS